MSPDPDDDGPATRGQRAAAGCAGIVLAAVVMSVAAAVHPYWSVAVGAALLGVWIRVNESRIRTAGQDPQPLPSPTVMGAEDWESPDGSRVYRKRGHGSGYDIESAEADSIRERMRGQTS